MQILKPDKGIIKIFTLARLFAFLIIITVFIIFRAFFISRLGGYSRVSDYIFLAFLFCFGYFTFIYPRIEYKNLFFYLCCDYIWIKRGTVIRIERVIPSRSIQHISLEEGPFFKLFGLSALVISTAGGRFVIKGLKVGKARQAVEMLKDCIIRNTQG